MSGALTWDPSRPGGAVADDGRSGNPPAYIASLVSGSGVSGFIGATYEVTGLLRLLSYVAGGVTYAVAYGTNTITITGSDASTKLITLDGSGRIVSVV